MTIRELLMKNLPDIFKAYDIRGLSPNEIDTDFAYSLGQAFARFTKAKIVVVGRDMRQTSPELSKALIDGICSQGAQVVDIGMVTTPMFYFGLAAYEGHEAGIMVTASHNPPQYNGFKLAHHDAMPIGGQELQELKKFVAEAPYPTEGIEKEKISKMDVSEAYLDKVLGQIDISGFQKLNVAVDGSNGMAGVILPKLFKRISAKVEALYWQPDGTFPNHEANPLNEKVYKDLTVMVKEKKADLGVIYDGDGDRIGFTDETGRIISPDLVGALLSAVLLKKYPAQTMLCDLRCGNVFGEEVARNGGKYIMTRVGHAFIKKEMKNSGAIFAAEMAGHFYFSDFFGVECSDLVMLLLLETMRKTGKKVSELVKPLRRYAHSGEINFEVGNKEKIVADIESQYASGGKVSKIDGLRVDFPDWWFSVRLSNTEPLLRLNLEAKTKELMEEKREELVKVIKD